MENQSPTQAHTAGPWHHSWLDDIHGWILDDQGHYLAEIVTYDEEGLYVDEAEQLANSRLIAAGPELLAHLTGIVEMAKSVAANWESGNLDQAVRNLDRIATAAEVAIRKAEGR